MAKKYKRCGEIPFIKTVGHKEYMRVRRSKNPLETADDLGLVDKKKIKKLLKLLSMELLIIANFFFYIR